MDLGNMVRGTIEADVSARNRSITALTTASLYAPACATGMAATLATSAMKGGSRTQELSHMLWIAGESENKRATPMHALYSTVVAIADAASGRMELKAMFMQRTAACAMTAIHC
uniref:Uncharacterized protein n=1 Tax=Dunaliella tertiolecta TaxID=3047 RepID=A0A6S8P6Q4_DUNTE